MRGGLHAQPEPEACSLALGPTDGAMEESSRSVAQRAGRLTTLAACAFSGTAGSFTAGSPAGMAAWNFLREEPRTNEMCSVMLVGGGGAGSFRTCGSGGNSSGENAGHCVSEGSFARRWARGSGSAGRKHLPNKNVLAGSEPVELNKSAEVDLILIADLPEGFAGPNLRRRAQNAQPERSWRGDSVLERLRAPPRRTVCVFPLSYSFSTGVAGTGLSAFAAMGAAAGVGEAGGGGGGAGFVGAGAAAALACAATLFCGADSATGMTSFSLTCSRNDSKDSAEQNASKIVRGCRQTP